MLKVQTLTVGQLQENTYFVTDSDYKETLLVDPGDEAEYIIQKLTDLDLIPSQIVATHAHFDHIQAVLPLQLAYDIPFYMHEKDKELLKHYRSSTKYFTNIDPGPPPHVTRGISSLDSIHVGKHKFSIIEIPGHTPGSIALYSQENDLIFVGDVIFKGGVVGRTDLPYSSKKELINSIEKLISLPQDTVVYAGHDDSTTIGEFIKSYKLFYE